jgi:hypothetical protein
LWLDITEKCFRENKYPEPELFSIPYKERTLHFNPTPQSEAEKYFNRKIIESMVIETNHLLDYIKKAIKLKRDNYCEAIAKQITKYENFLLKYHISRDEDGYFLVPLEKTS